jgi:hypothetical protein
LVPGLRIGGLALASRLSFFLWSSIPHDELLEVAAGGRLSDPAILERQVLRMLADRRADAFVDNFAGQWLRLRELDDAEPEVEDFDDNLRQAFRRETELLFASIRISSGFQSLRVPGSLAASTEPAGRRLGRHHHVAGGTRSQARRHRQRRARAVDMGSGCFPGHSCAGRPSPAILRPEGGTPGPIAGRFDTLDRAVVCAHAIVN